jgi:glycosyltransferase involved in cell wall biosynthesis
MSINSVVAYSAYPWDHVLTTLRLVHPIELAELRLIRGNEKENIHVENVSLGDIIVIQREFPDYYKMCRQIVARARAEGKAVIYEIDDLLLELPQDHPARSIDYYTPGLFSILQMLVEADLVITTTKSLQNYFLPLNPQTHVLPNYLDDQVWELPAPRRKSEHLPVVLGYMGSKTHQSDLALISPVLTRLIDRYGNNLQIHFWGEEPPPPLLHHSNVKRISLENHNYAEFAQNFSQQECDVYLAPLSDTFFNQCKSSIKYLEYSSQAIPGVYSRIAPYETIITQGEDGFLASSDDDWETFMTSLIESEDLRYQMGLKAQHNVIKNWLLSDHSQEWRDIYNKAAALSAQKQISESKQEYLQFFTRVVEQTRGWHEKLYAQLEQKDQVIQSLQSQLIEAKAQTADPHKLQEELNQSIAWRFVQVLWPLRRRLFPPGSRRERMYLKLTSWLRHSD